MRDATKPSVHRRRWADVRAGRLCLGLGFGPLLAGVVYLNIELFERRSLGLAAASGAVVFAASSLWFFVAGLAYVLLKVRRREHVSRSECLVFGAVASLPLPLIFQLTANLILRLGRYPDASIPFTYEPVWIPVLLAFGLLSGWLLWKIGFRE